MLHSWINFLVFLFVIMMIWKDWSTKCLIGPITLSIYILLQSFPLSRIYSCTFISQTKDNWHLWSFFAKNDLLASRKPLSCRWRAQIILLYQHSFLSTCRFNELVKRIMILEYHRRTFFWSFNEADWLCVIIHLC